MQVADVKDRKDLQFISDSQDVKALKEYFNSPEIDEYDTFLVKVGEGCYEELYGMYGTIPFLMTGLYPLNHLICVI